MASVISILDAHNVGGPASSITSWVDGTAASKLRAAARALVSVARLPRGTVVHAHLSERGSFVREGLLLAVARAGRRATVATLHGADFESFAGSHPKITRHVLERCNLVLTLTDASSRTVNLVAPGAKSAQIANPVEFDENPTAAGLQPPRALFAGEISRRKGADLVAGLWADVRAAVPDAELVMVGPHADVDIQPEEGVRVLRPVDRGTLRSHMREARVVVLPSRAEALPMVLLEAQGAARPFLSTPVGQIEALARDGGGGRVVPVNDAAALTAALVALLGDPNDATELGVAGWTSGKERYSVAALDHQMQQLYAALPNARWDDTQ